MSTDRSLVAFDSIYTSYGLCVQCKSWDYVTGDRLSLCRDCNEPAEPSKEGWGLVRYSPTPNPLLAVAPKSPTVWPILPSSRATIGRHFKLEFRGPANTPDQRALFHGILKYQLDPTDYPIDPMYRHADTIAQCSGCLGVVWYNPSLQPSHLRKLANQLGLHIRITGWRAGRLCGNAPVLAVPVGEFVGNLI